MAELFVYRDNRTPACHFDFPPPSKPHRPHTCSLAFRASSFEREASRGNPSDLNIRHRERQTPDSKFNGVILASARLPAGPFFVLAFRVCHTASCPAPAPAQPLLCHS